MSTDHKEPIASQPQATAPMSAGGNRNVLNRELGVDGKRDWSFGLFSCTDDCGLCCRTVLCPCMSYSQSKQRLQHLQTHGTPLPGGGDRYTADCAIYTCLIIPCYSWVLLIGDRGNIRSRYNIRGSTIKDCFTVWWCRGCALVQERREIELEENSFEGFPQSK